MAKFKLRKALAIALATATAFTFSVPMGLIQTSIVAEAAGADADNELDTITALAAYAANGELAYDTDIATSGANEVNGYLYVKPGTTFGFTVANAAAGQHLTDAATKPTCIAPSGWTVTAEELAADTDSCLITVTAPTTKTNYAWDAKNIVIKINSIFINLAATNDSYTQEIGGNESFKLSPANGAVTMADIIGADYAKLTGFASATRADLKTTAANGTFALDQALLGLVSATSDGQTAISYSDDVAYNSAATIKAAATSIGSSGKITFKNPKNALVFGARSKIGTALGNTSTDAVDILAATKSVTVNVINTVKPVTSSIKIGTSAKITVPFKALTTSSTGVTCTEVADADGTAKSSASAGVTIDNTEKTITFAANTGASGGKNYFFKFTPASGDATTITISADTSGSSINTDMVAGSAIAVGSNSSNAVDLTPPATIANNDKYTFLMKDDTVDALVSASYFTSTAATTVAENPVVSAGTADPDAIKISVGNGVTAGSYTGYLSFYDDSTKEVFVQEVTVAVVGTSKDDPYMIGIEKINNTAVNTWGGYSKDYVAASLTNAVFTAAGITPGSGSLTTDATNWDTTTFTAKNGLAATTAGKVVYEASVDTYSSTIATPKKITVTAEVAYNNTGGLFAAGTTDTLANIMSATTIGGRAGATAPTSISVGGVKYNFDQAKNAVAAVAKTSWQGATILSGADTTLTLTSPLKEAGLVKDMAIASLQVENPSTGARVSEGFTIDGMSIKIAANALEAGKGYYVFVTTKGTGVSESDAMTKTGAHIYLSVKQGYTFNYNLGNATVKDGKTLPVVSISSSESSGVHLEDGSNLSYTGATFLGWSYTDGAEKADISAADAKAGLSPSQIKTAIDKEKNTVIDIYGVWSYTSYTMSYDNNGGSGSATNKNFTVATTDVVLPSEGFANGNKPLIGWSTTSTGKTAKGGTLPVYTGTLNSAQLQAIVKEVDETAKTTAIKLYAQYGAALKSVSITPATVSLTAKGATSKLTAEVLDENNAKMTTATVIFKSDNEGVATVDANGVVTAVANGTANITATAKLGTVEVTSTACVVTVKIVKKAVTFKNVKKTFKVATLKKAKKTYSVIKASDGGKVTYKVTKGTKKYITVSKAGKVTVKKGAVKGTYKVKVTVAAKGNYKKTVQTITIVVK